MSQAYIAGMGIITAIGQNVSENLDALSNSRHGLSRPEILSTRHTLPVGEIKMTNQELATLADAPTSWPRTALLSLIAAREAWKPLAQKAKGLRTAFLSANTVGGMDLTENVYADWLKDKRISEALRYHETGTITQLVADRLVPGSWNTTISTACSSSANTIMMAAQLVKEDKFDMVIAGGADSLSRFTLNGFNSLMILDKELCRPFDENRQGLNLGEGAAYLIIASEQAMHDLGAASLGIVSGYANANDAHHQTASSPEGRGNQLAMQKALEQAALPANAIDYINLHGTGTENNDASEGKAISLIFNNKVPAASSTKAFTGHTLAAAGAVEAVYSVLSLQQQTIWPHLRLQTPISNLDWQPQTKLSKKEIRHVLSNSFGFGGNCSTLILSNGAIFK